MMPFKVICPSIEKKGSTESVNQRRLQSMRGRPSPLHIERIAPTLPSVAQAQQRILLQGRSSNSTPRANTTKRKIPN
jgi:hypothetical protein